MRTFIAVEPPDTLREEIGALTARLAQSWPGSARWVDPKNMHLTLRFLGEIEPSRLNELERVAGRAAQTVTQFGLEVDSIGYFGPERSPRIIWLGLKDCPSLGRLAAEMEKALQAAQFGRADKPFRGHLTLARLKQSPARPPDWPVLRSRLPARWPAWPVTEVQIIKSTLTPSGPHYETLARCSLEAETDLEIGGDG